jgi:hypothetical protein
MLMAGVAYYVLSRLLISHHGRDSALAIALGKDYKGIASLVLYIVAIVLSFKDSRISIWIYVLVALMWFIPDPRIEKVIAK